VLAPFEAVTDATKGPLYENGMEEGRNCPATLTNNDHPTPCPEGMVAYKYVWFSCEAGTTVHAAASGVGGVGLNITQFHRTPLVKLRMGFRPKLFPTSAMVPPSVGSSCRALGNWDTMPVFGSVTITSDTEGGWNLSVEKVGGGLWE
jgi:hypothetical protein